MALYENQAKKSWLAIAEFSPISDGNLTFFHIRDRARREKVKTWLTSPEVGQEILAETVVNSRPVFVTRGSKTQEQMKDLLTARGDVLTPYERKVPFSEKAWQTGATLALIGQGMQLASSGLRPNRKVDWPLRMLAIPNLTATAIILAYGAQRTPDDNQLRFLKNHINDELDDYVPEGDALPGLGEDRSSLREEPPKPKTLTQKCKDFLRRNSVSFGEIGLRYLGAVSLAFPANKWGKTAGLLEKGAFKEAYQFGKTPSPLTHYAGLASLTGKTVALASQAPDPYDPKPHTAMDDIREKFTFRTGGWIETAAFAAVAADGFMNKKISFRKGGKEYRDFISGIGGSLFTIRYIIRHWAPFGVKEMDMNELYAHASDSLAKMPRDKLPQLISETAADLADHFKNKDIQFGQIFTRLVSDLHRYHHISAVDPLQNGTEAAPATRVASNAPAQPDTTVRPQDVQAFQQPALAVQPSI